jgi:CheY-like chemotaxis protein
VNERRQRVLVADDDDEIRDLLCMVLEQKYDVVAVANGFDAIQRLEAETFDAAVLDLTMPILGGQGVVHEIRRRNLRIPFALFSGDSDLPRIAAELNVPHHLSKPADPVDVRRLVERLLQPARLRAVSVG